jgi:phosphoribosylformylglycinamidine cyclo-ligase
MSESEMLRPKDTLTVGDVAIAIPSVSAHTNGYTLINRLYREALADGVLDLTSNLDIMLQSDYVSLDWFLSLSTPHKCYLDDIKTLSEKLCVKGLAHITGGGLIDNPPRILPDGLAFRFDRKAIDTNMSNDFKLLWKMSGFNTHLEM